MRLGDLDALKEAFNKDIERFGDIPWHISAIETEIDAMPTIDAVPEAQLREMLSNLERMCRGGDEGETYTIGYRNGHHNGQIELLRYILQVPDGTSENESKGD